MAFGRKVQAQRGNDAAWIDVALSDAECEAVGAALQAAFERAGGVGEVLATNISWRKMKTDGIFTVMDKPGLFKSNVTAQPVKTSRLATASAPRARKGKAA